MKNTLKSIALILLIMVAGCNFDKLDEQPDRTVDIEGIVYAKDEERILVVEGITSADIPYEEWSENGKNAISFIITEDTTIILNNERVSFNDINKGDKVQVWSTGELAESYPMQGKALYVIIVKSE